MIRTKDCTVRKGNLQSRNGENAFFDHLLPFACNNSKAKSPNMHNKLWLNSTTEEQSPPFSCFHLSYPKMRSMPVHGYSEYVKEEDVCSETTIPVSDQSSTEVKDMEHLEAIVAAQHLLLLSNSFQSEQRGRDSMLRKKFMKIVRNPFEEKSDSTPASLSTTLSPSSNDCRSSGSHNNIVTQSSSMVTDSEVTSESNGLVRKRKKNALVMKRKKANGRLLADIVGQEKDAEVKDRPKCRYKSLQLVNHEIDSRNKF